MTNFIHDTIKRLHYPIIELLAKLETYNIYEKKYLALQICTDHQDELTSTHPVNTMALKGDAIVTNITMISGFIIHTVDNKKECFLCQI